MVTREKSKEALPVASTVTHFTEIVVARGTGRYITSRDRPWDPLARTRARNTYTLSVNHRAYIPMYIYHTYERTRTYTCTYACGVRYAMPSYRSKIWSDVLSLSSQLAHLISCLLARCARDCFFLLYCIYIRLRERV